ncbi:hypothetical protein EDB84DRAFT_1443833 [Lactarius hengduanensis]|nr:hypothetical protein EDB84DRAFT_1443833 [Lactarius hengduanensis]
MASHTARPLFLTVAGPVTLVTFYHRRTSFGIGHCTTETRTAHVWRHSLRICTRRRRNTLKAREGLIKKHGPSKEEIESYLRELDVRLAAYGLAGGLLVGIAILLVSAVRVLQTNLREQWGSACRSSRRSGVIKDKAELVF